MTADETHNSKIQDLTRECQQIEEDALLYTAETHYIIAGKIKKTARRNKFVPAAITVVSAFVLAATPKAPDWINWITLVGALVTIGSLLVDQEHEAYAHEFAAKSFTSLKHEARSLHECFKNFVGEKEFYYSVKELRQRYNLLAQQTPSTNQQAFARARKNIQDGRHRADFRNSE